MSSLITKFRLEEVGKTYVVTKSNPLWQCKWEIDKLDLIDRVPDNFYNWVHDINRDEIKTISPWKRKRQKLQNVTKWKRRGEKQGKKDITSEYSSKEQDVPSSAINHKRNREKRQIRKIEDLFKKITKKHFPCKRRKRQK